MVGRVVFNKRYLVRVEDGLDKVLIFNQNYTTKRIGFPIPKNLRRFLSLK